MNPLELVKQDALECMWEAPRYLFFSVEVDPLVYYSHLFPAAAVLLLAGVILFSQRKLLTSKLFIIIASLFAVYALVDLAVWASINPSMIMFLWSSLIYIEPLIYAFTLYLVLVYVKRKDISIHHKLGAGALLLPLILLGPTSLNLAGFDYNDCWRLAVEGGLSPYLYFVEFVFVVWMIIETIIHLKKHGR